MIPSEGRITFVYSVSWLENLNTIYKAIIETSPSGLFWNVFLNITDVNLFNIYKVTVDLNLFSVDFFSTENWGHTCTAHKKWDKSIEEASLLCSVENIQDFQGQGFSFDAWNVHLNYVLVWAIREQRLYSYNSEDKEFNIKLDGRPLGGVFSFE